MKKNMKKNNKGFSLVELIVVVLIMGIIAVALAPQVMKWVGQARTNSDSNTAKDVKSAVQIAVADYQGEGHALTAAVTFNFDATGVNALTDTNLQAKIKEVSGEDYPTTSNNGSFSVTISADHVVSVSY